MATTVIHKKPIEQMLIEKYPIECCEGATAELEAYDRAHFLAGSTEEHNIRCSKCLKKLVPATKVTLSPVL